MGLTLLNDLMRASRLIPGFFAAWLAIFSPEIAAQPQAGEDVTITAWQKPVFIGGQLQGCALNFEVGHIDYEYNNGKMTYITGSLNFYTFPGKEPSYGLKIGIRNEANSPFVAPVDAHLIYGLETNSLELHKKLDADSDGFRLFAFSAGEMTNNAAIGKIAETGKLHVGYVMRPGGMSSNIVIDTTVKELNFSDPRRSLIDENAPRVWIDCLASVIENARVRQNGAAEKDAQNAATDAASAAMKAAMREAKR